MSSERYLACGRQCPRGEQRRIETKAYFEPAAKSEDPHYRRNWIVWSLYGQGIQ
jgi:hypothetical protein